MASIRDLKKDINFVLGDIIDAVYIWEAINPKEDQKEAEAIVDDAIVTFDELIAKVNNNKVENRRKHLKAVNAELEERGKALIDRVNAL
ncbi:hypothetical protein [Leeuwenhoekiella palythoae]|uniref:Uncharacterized protein n=1 Tax=Leeuwenhoekiella palythoae TaxID=573501 RepID=A0A1M5UK19_9FLAO|nr:hypothetical protein [Leeuwenhoekiella palythoae]RXG27088.1 hypothetical protein DSM01_3161 [Leeuwenhoekiella palythoae]UBZ11113.1 hypothetical protein LDL79_03090 [Leeuwenhoekiella palythoae]SHH63270.1 hypothetical protein SAMN04487999_0701 [Leeuwenhoekiella palythoae]|tara:strand:- start:22 stop:288 length:267 start_codon:yes stop_codon:yes gene_type:complete